MTAERSDMVVDLSIFCDEGNESEKERKKLNQEGMIMEYIQVTRENIEKEHICCAISNNKDVQVSSKKAWKCLASLLKAHLPRWFYCVGGQPASLGFIVSST